MSEDYRRRTQRIRLGNARMVSVALVQDMARPSGQTPGANSTQGCEALTFGILSDIDGFVNFSFTLSSAIRALTCAKRTITYWTTEPKCQFRFTLRKRNHPKMAQGTAIMAIQTALEYGKTKA